MEMKHYVVAGLDFIFDSKGNPWFLEANSASTVHKEIEDVYGDCITVKKLADYIKEFKPKNLCVFVRKHHEYTDKKENTAWLPNRLKKFLSCNIHTCYMEDNLRISRDYLVDYKFNRLIPVNCRRGGGNSYILNSSRRKVKPDVIIRNYFQLNPEFEGEAKVINSMAVRDLVWFKNKCYDVVKSIKGIKIPKYFIVHSKEEIKKALKDHPRLFKNGYVIKPVDDSLGRRVHVTDSPRLVRNLKLEKQAYMLQQKITPKLIDGKKYWDVRVFVINGKFVGAVKRTSKNKVTNIARGSKGTLLEKNFQNKIKDISIKIAKTIEKEARKMDEQGYICDSDVKFVEVSKFPTGEE